MVSKRCFYGTNDDDLDVPAQEFKRRHTLATAVREVMRGLSMQELLVNLEPFLRKVVREEIEHGVKFYTHSSPRPSINQIEASGTRGCLLHFRNKLPHTLFTGSRIETKNGTPVEIVILDASSKNIITSGPLSSMKVDILVLDGDFGTDEQEDWTKKEFDASVIREREGKRPLVTGELVVTLRDGVGYLGDIAFTDNSSWIRSRKFRLGGRAVPSTSFEERIREARSEAFIVKDHRGELYKKHHPPSLGDEVWRLERIGKDGAFHNRLASKGINTVQDFLRQLVTEQSLLRSILGNGMSSKTWETIVHHAEACTLNNKQYMYYNAGQKVAIVFNSIYKVVGAKFDGQSYQPLDSLTPFQMSLVEGLKRQAYRNVKDIVEIDEPLFDGPLRPLPRLQSASFPGSSQDVQHLDFPITLQDQLETQLGFNHLANPSPFLGEDCLEEAAVMQSCHPVQALASMQMNSFNMRDSWAGPSVNDGSEWAPGGPSGPVLPGGHLAGDNISQVQWQNLFPVSATWEYGNGMFLGSSDEASIGLLSSLPDLSVHISTNCKPHMRWFKLRAAFKWGISVRRDVAAKRRARFPQLIY